MKSRMVKYAGLSQVVDESGNSSVHFHTSNNTKYAVWSMLPSTVDGPGHQVAFHWFKMPPHTNKLNAVKFLLASKHIKNQSALVDALRILETKLSPAEKTPKASKVSKPKTLTVEKKAKTPATGKKADTMAKIREAVAKRKEDKPTAAPKQEQVAA